MSVGNCFAYQKQIHQVLLERMASLIVAKEGIGCVKSHEPVYVVAYQFISGFNNAMVECKH